ncbi:MAG: hypothetical protein ACI83P_002142 [Janthinobacterium sp.]|jgi:hypothetical protein
MDAQVRCRRRLLIIAWGKAIDYLIEHRIVASLDDLVTMPLRLSRALLHHAFQAPLRQALNAGVGEAGCSIRLSRHSPAEMAHASKKIPTIT